MSSFFVLESKFFLLSSCHTAQNLTDELVELFYKVTSNHFNNFKFPGERNSYYENIMPSQV